MQVASLPFFRAADIVLRAARYLFTSVLQDLLSPFRLRAFRNFDALFVFMMDIFMRVFFLGKIRRFFQESRILRVCDLLIFDDPWRFALL